MWFVNTKTLEAGALELRVYRISPLVLKSSDKRFNLGGPIIFGHL